MSVLLEMRFELGVAISEAREIEDEVIPGESGRLEVHLHSVMTRVIAESSRSE